MRHTVSGLIAAIVMVTASAAQACGGGLFESPCYVYGCEAGCAGFERLPDPVPHHYSNFVHQYYYVNQGPTYTGPGAFAPYPVYEEGAYGYPAYHRTRYAMPRRRPHPHRMTHEPIHDK